MYSIWLNIFKYHYIFRCAPPTVNHITVYMKQPDCGRDTGLGSLKVVDISEVRDIRYTMCDHSRPVCGVT